MTVKCDRSSLSPSVWKSGLQDQIDTTASLRTYLVDQKTPEPAGTVTPRKSPRGGEGNSWLLIKRRDE
jgi:hypothetical protein